MTPEETKQFIGSEGGRAYLKFVRFEDGVILFSDAADYFAKDHTGLAFDHQSSFCKPVSAALIKVRHGSFRLEGHSTMLRLSWSDEDIKPIEKALGLTYNDSWEFWDN